MVVFVRALLSPLFSQYFVDEHGVLSLIDILNLFDEKHEKAHVLIGLLEQLSCPADLDVVCVTLINLRELLDDALLGGDKNNNITFDGLTELFSDIREVIEDFISSLPINTFNESNGEKQLEQLERQKKLKYLRLPFALYRHKKSGRFSAHIKTILRLTFSYQIYNKVPLTGSTLNILLKNKFWAKDLTEKSTWSEVLKALKEAENRSVYASPDANFYQFYSTKRTYKLSIDTLDVIIKDEYLQTNLPLYKRMRLPNRTGDYTQSIDDSLSAWLNKKVVKGDWHRIASKLNILLIMLSGKNQSDINELLISSLHLPEYQNDYICLTTNRWYKKSLKLPNAITPVQDDNLLLPHKDSFYVNIPQELMELLISGLKHTKQVCLSFSKLKSYLLSGNSVQWPYNENGSKIKESQIRQAIFNELSDLADEHSASLITTSIEQVDASELYYLSLEQSDICSLHNEAILSLGFEITESSTDEELFVVGSKLALNFDAFSEQLNERINVLVQNVQNTLDSPHFTKSDFIKSHNRFTAYLSFMMLANTGHRNANPYTFCYRTMSGELFLIKDKEKRMHSSIRVIDIAELMKEQLEEYFTFCKYVASSIQGENFKHIKEHLKEISLDKPTPLATFGFINEHAEWRPVSHELILKYLGWDHKLPENLFRHAFSSYLRKVNKGELASNISGRVSHSEHQLCRHSPFTIVAMKNNVLGDFLQRLGFKLIKNNYHVSKRSKLSSNKKIKEIYSPYKKRVDRALLAKTVYQKLQRMLSQLGVYTNSDVLVEIEEDSARWQEVQDVFSEVERNIETVFIKAKDISRANKYLKLIKVRYLKGRRIQLHHRFDNALGIDDDLIYFNKQVSKAKKAIIAYVLKKVKEDTFDNEILFLSMLMFVNRRVTISKAFLAGFFGDWYFENGVAWFYWSDKGTKRRLVIDSFTLLIKTKINSGTKVHFSKSNSFVKLIQSILTVDNEVDDFFIGHLKSTQKINALFSQNFDNDLPSYLRYYRSDKFDAKQLSEGAFHRLFFSTSIQVDRLSRPRAHKTEESIIDDSFLKFKKLKTYLNSFSKNHTQITTHEIQSEISKIWFGAEKGNVQKWSFYRETTDLSPVVKLIFEYAFHLPTTKGHRNRNKGTSTIQSYVVEIGERILNVVKTSDILNFSSKEFINLYATIMASIKIASSDQISERLRFFHVFIVEHFGAEDINWSQIKPYIKLPNKLNTGNIITANEYELIDNLLKADACLNEVEMRCCRLMLLMGFKLGLRFDDAVGLKFSDFDMKNSVLSVKSNDFRRVKTPDSNRAIFFGAILNAEEIDLLRNQWDYIEKSNDNILFFKTTLSACSYDDFEKSLKILLDRVVEAIRCVTGDESLSFHDLRGSFASSVFMLLIYSEEHPYGDELLRGWFGNKVLEKSKKLRLDLTGSEELSIKVLPALSQCIGHSTPSTTMEYYIAIFEYLLYSYNESQVCSLIPNNILASLLNEKPSTVTKNFYDTKQVEGRSLSIKRYLQKYQVVELSNMVSPIVVEHKNEKGLKDKPISVSDYFVILPKLKERIEKALSYQSSDTRAVNTLVFIRSKTGFDGISQPALYEDSRTYININLKGKYYVEIVSALNQLSKLTLKHLADQWISHFHPIQGLSKKVLPFTIKPSQVNPYNNSYQQVQNLLKKLNIDLIEQVATLEKKANGLEVKLQKLKMNKGKKEASEEFQTQFHNVMYLNAFSVFVEKAYFSSESFHEFAFG